jgi:multidrug efflux pump
VKLIELFIRRPVLAAMLSLALLVSGTLAYVALPVREFPDADPPIVSVTTFLPGANPRVMESAVTDVLEEELGSVEGLRTIASASREELSIITLEFTLDRNIDAAAQDVRDKVARARGELPADVEEPVVAKQEADASPIMFLAVTGPMDRLVLTDVAERLVKKRVERVPGVARAELYGERRFAMRIWIDNAALTAQGLVVQDVERAIRSRSVEIPGGRIESTDREFTVRSLGELRTPEEFADLTVASIDGHLVKLRDVAKVELGPESDRISFRSDRQDAVGVGVVRQSRSNLIDVAKAVEAELPLIRQTLPAGVEVNTVYETAQYVERSILEAEETLLIAAGLVILIIFLFLRTLRGTLIPAIAIPVSIVATFAVMYALGHTLNNFTLLALILAIGIVVDDAIIVLENAYRRQEELGEDPATAALRGTREIAAPVIAVTLSLVAVFLPLAFLTGTTGRLLNEFGAAVAAAVAISGFVALTLTPVLCARFLKLPARQSTFHRVVGGALDALSDRYRRALEWALDRQWRVIGGGLLTAVAAVVILQQLNREFVPADDRGYVITAVIAPDGATEEYTSRYQRRLEGILAATPDVHNQVSIIGWPEDPSRGLIFGMLDDWSTRSRSSFDIISELQPQYFGVPGVLAFAVNPPPLASSGGGAAPVQYVVQHATFDSLVAGMQRFSARVRQVPGLVNVDVDLRVTKPELTVAFDRDRAEDLGVSIRDAAGTLQSLLSDREVARFTRDNELYDVIVRLRPEDRATPDAISRMYVRGNGGALMPLSSIASITEDVGPRQLNHFNRLRSFTLSASLAPGVTLGPVIDSLDAIAAETLPVGSSQALTGESRELRESGRALYLAFGLALLVVYMVLAAQFGSVIHPFTVLLAVPLAVTGALVALWLTGSTLNLYSQIGMILLIGLAAKNSILLVEYINHLKEQGLAVREAILEAGRIRLRPILMTSVAALLGAVPIALGLGAGSASRRPLGLAVVGGLVFSTVFTLFLVPAVYQVLEALQARFAAPEASRPRALTPLEIQ